MVKLKFAYILPTWFPGFAYMLPTCCLHIFRVFLPISWFFLHNFFIIGVPFWQSASGTLPSIKLRLAAHQVTPRRQSSYASPPIKLRFNALKPMLLLGQNYVFTWSKLRFYVVIPMFSRAKNVVFAIYCHTTIICHHQLACSLPMFYELLWQMAAIFAKFSCARSDGNCYFQRIKNGFPPLPIGNKNVYLQHNSN